MNRLDISDGIGSGAGHDRRKAFRFRSPWSRGGHFVVLLCCVVIFGSVEFTRRTSTHGPAKHGLTQAVIPKDLR